MPILAGQLKGSTGNILIHPMHIYSAVTLQCQKLAHQARVPNLASHNEGSRGFFAGQSSQIWTHTTATLLNHVQ